MRKRRVGIFGGAFDPIHYGHIMVAKHCLHAYELNEVLFVPTNEPLLKQACVAKPWQRAAMVALAISGYPHFHLNTCELIRDTPSYALLTLQNLHASFPSHEFFWILGADAFAQFTKWHGFKEIATLCDLLVISREQEGERAANHALVEACFAEAGHQVFYSAMPLLNIASSVIREDFARFQTHIPDFVWRFIVENKIYPLS